MEGELRNHVERLLLRMKLVTREEFEVVEALAQKARAEQEILAERLAALEAQGIDVLRTDRGGEILWETDGDEVRVTRP